MALRALVKAEQVARSADRTSVSQLYRSMIRELPRVLAIYDVDMPTKTARDAVSFHFRKHQNIKDGRIISILLAKGYMELEETLMQWKQKTHLLRLLEPIELNQDISKKLPERYKELPSFMDEDD